MSSKPVIPHIPVDLIQKIRDPKQPSKMVYDKTKPVKGLMSQTKVNSMMTKLQTNLEKLVDPATPPRAANQASQVAHNLISKIEKLIATKHPKATKASNASQSASAPGCQYCAR